MNLTTPIFFEPLFMERVWGGRKLASLFSKKLPPGVRIGESWEMVDREEAQSVVHEGILRGKTLHELWTDYREPVFGERHRSAGPRFPLLIKLLDAEEKLSVQVHPPPAAAAELGGEPKTEMWYVAAAEPDADIFAGLRAGTTREQFAAAITKGAVADLLHRLPVKPGDSIFIPAGRIHAIGAGNVIVEIQQNSDTTYRVFDWNRSISSGIPRALHIKESMKSIHFEDHAPSFQPPGTDPLVDCEHFQVRHWTLEAAREAVAPGEFAAIVVLHGAVACAGSQFGPGECFLVPACLKERLLTPLEPGATLLRATIAR